MAVVYIYHSRFSREHLHALQRDPPHNDGTPGFSEAVVAAAYRPEWFDNCSADYEKMCYDWSTWKRYGNMRETIQPDWHSNLLITMSRDLFSPRPLQPWLERCARELGWEKYGELWENRGGPPRPPTLGERLMYSVLNWEPEIIGVVVERIRWSRTEVEPHYLPLLDLIKNESEEDRENYVAAMLYAEIDNNEIDNENN
jgi:hypothetical protein